MNHARPARDPDKCLYIYTMPKAGTYMLASLCEELGMVNSGRHIGFTGYLDTLAYPAKLSRNHPSQTRQPQQYIKTFKQCAGQVAFGHLSPTFLPPGVFFATQVIASYRNPMEVLISEFNDFRFIRQDVKFCSIETEPNDNKAFALYLKRQATVIRDIMIEMARYLDCFTNPLYAPKYSGTIPLVINFNRLKEPDYASWLNQLFASFLPGHAISLNDALKATYNKETKTRSRGYTFNVDSLWDEANLAIVRPLRLKRLHRHIMEQETTITSTLQ